jgi:hypothetical protein
MQRTVIAMTVGVGVALKALATRTRHQMARTKVAAPPRLFLSLVDCHWLWWFLNTQECAPVA